jgi:thioredoxin reductase (NADPH)
MFIFAGYLPATSLLKGKVEMTEEGYVVTDTHQKTSLDGVYAAGDLCVKPLRQVVTAVSDGAVAATSLEKYIFQMHEKGYQKGQAPHAAETEPKPEAHEREASASETAASKPVPKPAAMIPENALGKIRESFSALRRKVVLEGLLDDSPLSQKVETFLSEIAGAHENVSVSIHRETPAQEGRWYPAIRILSEEGEFLRAQFHGVPGGHELNSFLETVKAAGGAGEEQGEALDLARKFGDRLNLKILVTLSCTMCPDLVTAAQRIALENPKVEAEIFDVVHYPALLEKYHVMGVPCLVVNDEQTHFGRMNMEQLVSFLQTVKAPA